MFTNKKIAVVSVINDLVTDHRVYKTCMLLVELNYEVVLIGRKLPNSLPLPNWPFKAKRMSLLVNKGPLFYLMFNIRLFFKLLFIKADLLFANDLDTLAPNYWASKIKRIPLVYDSHELFCEVPELMQQPLKKRIWEKLEESIVPKLKFAITVSEGIANIFKAKYGVTFIVIRNIPVPVQLEQYKSRNELQLPEDKKIILLQGAGINIQRGAEELVMAMQYIDNALLLIIGSGDVWEVLKKMITEFKLHEKVKLINKLPKSELLHYTHCADLGISIDKNTNPNYYHSLPNKLFDYLHAGLPVLCSNLPELKKIINQYQVGEIIDSHDPLELAKAIQAILKGDKIDLYKQNAKVASGELSWQKEKQKYLEFLQRLSC